MGLSAAGLDWICRECGFKLRTRRLLALVYLEGYTEDAAAEELGMKRLSAMKLFRRVQRKMRLKREKASDGDRALWEYHLDGGDTEPRQEETERDHARHLLTAQANKQQPRDSAPEMDENGRPIGGRSPLVSVDEAVGLCRQVGSGRRRIL
jgi:hypothetical protein